ncbi:hypothetical protein ASPWEDRAFT_117838 [Aspergillus wentii DTO 134E9]|uniref:Ureidoglycolate hydrolase n=1 Tax=Aspergillus wentii DTO 134E9 TaxID=1073089 RepID=A0A1L9RAD5_ASPWE|nr:uncharacterized protein ASPWEDRAFT_117838 [Aspergillus wentii DTO 134E9]KAI9934485.1 hypothetical protein MW887_000099 [Aspergillus wentii]OJJ31895.1 hypothetical protein ASPWEDRAFT_117838 [Aspergillus wentii DTO 134E9]
MAPILPSTPSLHLTPEPLTPSAFAPFGTAIIPPIPRTLTAAPADLSSLPAQHHAPAPALANQSSALKYSPISPVLDEYASRKCASGKASAARMSMFACFPRTLRAAQGEKVFDVRILERHPFTTQTFTPIDLSAAGEDEPKFLVIVAPSLKGETVTATTAGGGSVTIRDPPDLKNMKAFLATGGQAVTYGVGTWHAPMVVLGGRRVDFVVVQFANGVDEEDCQEAEFGEGIVVGLKGGERAKL